MFNPFKLSVRKETPLLSDNFTWRKVYWSRS